MGLDRKTVFEEVQRGEHDIGRAIYLMRKSVGVNRKDFAQKVGVTYRTLTEIENGTGNPTVQTLEKVIRVFGFQLTLAKVK